MIVVKGLMKLLVIYCMNRCITYMDCMTSMEMLG